MSLDELRRATEQLPGYATMDYYTKCRPIAFLAHFAQPSLSCITLR